MKFRTYDENGSMRLVEASAAHKAAEQCVIDAWEADGLAGRHEVIVSQSGRLVRHYVWATVTVHAAESPDQSGIDVADIEDWPSPEDA